MKKGLRVIIGIGIVLLLLIIGLAIYNKIANAHFTTTYYEVETEKLSQDVKLVVLSDLHNQEYGEKNWELVSAIRAEEPDFIVMCGDMVKETEPDISVLLNLCRDLTDIADVYFLYGNHEGVLEFAEKGAKVAISESIAEEGVHVCWPGDYEITVGEDVIDFFSISISEENYRNDRQIQNAFEDFLGKDTYKIAASHYPQIFYDTFPDEDYDLAIAGHFHGGQIILPGIGGLYHTDTGFFPKYYGGEYQLGKGTLIISRGLGNSSFVPRINNRPELVVITIANKED